ncbi:MAG: PAS domain-containing protein, partial [Cyanobacteria bacterium J06600_6]
MGSHFTSNLNHIFTSTAMSNIDPTVTNQNTQLEQQRIVIEQQKQLLQSIYDNVREAIFVVDVEKDGIFRYQKFNAAAISLMGIDDGATKTPAQIFTPEVAARVTQHYQQCLKFGIPFSYEECLPFKGKDTWWLTTLNPLKDENGKVYRLIGTSLNIDERKQIESELQQEKIFIQTVLDHLCEGIVACDRQGTLALFNRASLDFFAVPQEPLPPERWAEHYNLYDAQGKELLKQHEIPLFRAFSGESFTNVELMTKPPAGTPRHLLTNGSPIVDANGENIGAVVAVHDITQRKHAEEALAKLNNELEDRVQNRTEQLEQVNTLLLAATTTLEDRNQELDRFAYIVSHDLKAPLRAISNLSTWIQEDLADKLDDDTQYNMDLLQNRVQRLESMIDSLLAYSRAGKSAEGSQLVAVGDMLAEVIDLLDPPANCSIDVQ